MVGEVRGSRSGRTKEKLNTHPEERGVLDTPVTHGHTSLLASPAVLLTAFHPSPTSLSPLQTLD